MNIKKIISIVVVSALALAVVGWFVFDTYVKPSTPAQGNTSAENEVQINGLVTQVTAKFTKELYPQAYVTPSKLAVSDMTIADGKDMTYFGYSITVPNADYTVTTSVTSIMSATSEKVNIMMQEPQTLSIRDELSKTYPDAVKSFDEYYPKVLDSAYLFRQSMLSSTPDTVKNAKTLGETQIQASMVALKVPSLQGEDATMYEFSNESVEGFVLGDDKGYIIELYQPSDENTIYGVRAEGVTLEQVAQIIASFNVN